MELLKFGKGNAKLGKKVYTFSLPSGFTCPSALECLSKANRETGKIVDGPETKFRCFSASQEALYKNVRQSRWKNFDLIKEELNIWTTEESKVSALALLLQLSMPKKADIIRIHVAGDFFNQIYFDSWIRVAQNNPSKLFYFYTKSLNYWLVRMSMIGNGHTPGSVNNFVPTASYGGRHDDLIKANNLRSAVVVYSKAEAKKLKLQIDHDDTHAMKHGKDFALIIHGTQPKGSEAGKALQVLKKEGFTGYNKRSLPVL